MVVYISCNIRCLSKLFCSIDKGGRRASGTHPLPRRLPLRDRRPPPPSAGAPTGPAASSLPAPLTAPGPTATISLPNGTTIGVWQYSEHPMSALTAAASPSHTAPSDVGVLPHRNHSAASGEEKAATSKRSEQSRRQLSDSPRTERRTRCPPNRVATGFRPSSSLCIARCALP